MAGTLFRLRCLVGTVHSRARDWLARYLNKYQNRAHFLGCVEPDRFPVCGAAAEFRRQTHTHGLGGYNACARLRRRSHRVSLYQVAPSVPAEHLPLRSTAFCHNLAVRFDCF